MGDRARISVSLSPQVQLTDADADSVFAVHHDAGRTVGSTFTNEVDKWTVDMAKNVSNSAIPLFGSSGTNVYEFIYLKNTGLDSSGNPQSRTVSLSIDNKVSYLIVLSAGESTVIPINSINEDEIAVVCSDIAGIVCEAIGGYTP